MQLLLLGFISFWGSVGLSSNTPGSKDNNDHASDIRRVSFVLAEDSSNVEVGNTVTEVRKASELKFVFSAVEPPFVKQNKKDRLQPQDIVILLEPSLEDSAENNENARGQLVAKIMTLEPYVSVLVSTGEWSDHSFNPEGVVPIVSFAKGMWEHFDHSIAVPTDSVTPKEMKVRVINLQLKEYRDESVEKWRQWRAVERLLAECKDLDFVVFAAGSDPLTDEGSNSVALLDAMLAQTEVKHKSFLVAAGRLYAWRADGAMVAYWAQRNDCCQRCWIPCCCSCCNCDAEVEATRRVGQLRLKPGEVLVQFEDANGDLVSVDPTEFEAVAVSKPTESSNLKQISDKL